MQVLHRPACSSAGSAQDLYIYLTIFSLNKFVQVLHRPACSSGSAQDLYIRLNEDVTIGFYSIQKKNIWTRKNHFFIIL